MAKSAKKAPVKSTATKKTVTVPAKKSSSVSAKSKKKTAPTNNKKKTAPAKNKKKTAPANNKKKGPPAKKKAVTKSAIATKKKSGAVLKTAAPKKQPKKSQQQLPTKTPAAAKKVAMYATTTFVPFGGVAPSNAAIINVFKQLSAYELKASDKPYVGVAYRKVVTALQSFVDQGNKITGGLDVAHLAGCGPATIKKIDEFISTGKVQRLEDLKDEIGDLPQALIASVGKSGGSGAAFADAGAAKKKKSSSGLSAAVLQKIADEKDNLETKSLSALKDLARLNDQKVTGTKGELCDLLAPQVVLGASVRCPTCGGGKLRFNLDTGVLSCPGYHDDTDYVACGARFDNSDPTIRKPWKWS